VNGVYYDELLMARRIASDKMTRYRWQTRPQTDSQIGRLAKRANAD
jgi:hypothetical protein